MDTDPGCDAVFDVGFFQRLQTIDHSIDISQIIIQIPLPGCSIQANFFVQIVTHNGHAIRV
jgi:hypothetical protein